MYAIVVADQIKELFPSRPVVHPEVEVVEVPSGAKVGWVRNPGGSFKALPPPTPRVPTRGDIQASRRAAYRVEADSLFFEAQRGEIDITDWRAKVAEIKARYPYPA